MVKKAKVKAKKTAAPKAKVARPAASTKTLAKYDQPGAPWWKKVAAPPPKY